MYQDFFEINVPTMKSNKLFYSIFILFSSWAVVGFCQDIDLGAVLSSGLGSGDVLSSGMGSASMLSSGLGSSVLGAAAVASANGIDVGAIMECVNKLLPCQSDLQSAAPSEPCCAAMNLIIANESQCICSVFNNSELLKNYNADLANVKIEDALNVAKICGAKPDLNMCNPSGSSTTPPAAAPMPPPRKHHHRRHPKAASSPSASPLPAPRKHHHRRHAKTAPSPSPLPPLPSPTTASSDAVSPPMSSPAAESSAASGISDFRGSGFVVFLVAMIILAF